MTTTENKVTLYIATHNKTGLKYFGKTTRYFTEQTLQENYHGSGLYWKRHIKKYGDDISMQIYGIFNIGEIEEQALKFSLENDIVASKDWANLKDENGLDGNPIGIEFTSQHKERIGEASKEKFKNIMNNNSHHSLKALKYWEYKSDMEMEEINKKKIRYGSDNGMFGVSRGGEKCPTFGKVWVTKDKNNQMIDEDYLAEYLNLGWTKGVYQKTDICKHCGVEMLKFHITRYHNEKCKTISEEPKASKVSKRNYNKLAKEYKLSGRKKKFPEFPKSGKLTVALKELFEEFKIEPYN